ncbi:MAG: erythromycin esterase family protein [Planctomycetota bacterium]|nr:erythromycin esterase family protein [Planctomycetota bacterium]
MRTSLLVAVLLLVPTLAGADEAQVAWLREHALKVRSIDPADEDFSDLAPLKKILGDARIVQLGEQTHADGACFLAKARLVRFLHQEMGFDVLAWESGFYDCAKGWENLRKDPKGTSEFDLGIFGIWTMSHQVKPTVDYLRAQAKGKRPLELCGYDCQLTSRVSRKHLLDDLRAVAKEAAPSLVQGESSKLIARAIQMLLSDKPKLTKEEAGNAEYWLALLRTELGYAKSNLDDRERAYWIQLTKSLEAQIRSIRARSAKTKPSPEDNNKRDRAMAENLIWLAEQHYPKRKIIVWAATFHLMRNPAKLKPLGGSLNYDKTIPMGHLVAKRFGKQCYTLGFTTYGGKAGRPFGNTTPWTVRPAPAGSFDAFCREAGLENAIVDLRAPPKGGAWLHKPFVTRPLGNSPMRGPWHQVVDGLFFQREMTPSTRGPYQPVPDVPRPSSGSLLDEIEKTWANVQSGLRSGNMWANKWTFDPALETWMAATERSKAQIAEQQKVVAGFLEKHKSEPEAVWRAHALSAEIAKACEDPKAAMKALEAAMEAFPTKDIPQASKTSQFQHLVNRYAFLLWDQKKKPPITWATGVLKKDERLRHFYWRAWTERDAGVASKLKKALKKAYKARKKKFPKQAAEIDRALAGL